MCCCTTSMAVCCKQYIDNVMESYLWPLDRMWAWQDACLEDHVREGLGLFCTAARILRGDSCLAPSSSLELALLSACITSTIAVSNMSLKHTIPLQAICVETIAAADCMLTPGQLQLCLRSGACLLRELHCGAHDQRSRQGQSHVRHCRSPARSACALA